MALLCNDVGRNIIKLIGCWHRDDMLSYLHVQVEPAMKKFSSFMLAHGTYYFMPHQEAPFF